MLRNTRASHTRNLASLSYHHRRQFSHLLPTLNATTTGRDRNSNGTGLEYELDVVLLARILGTHARGHKPIGSVGVGRRGKSFYSTTATTRTKDGKATAAKGETGVLDPLPPPHSNSPTTGKHKSSATKLNLTPRKPNGGGVEPAPVPSSTTNRSSSSTKSSSHMRSNTMSSEEVGSQNGSKLSHETPSPSTKLLSGLQARQTIQTPHLMVPSIPENLGIVKTALNDIEDAMANGTLKPLPPDLAARLKKAAEGDANATSGIDTVQVWWHKLKEMTKFYFFGVVALGREHRIRAKETRRRLRESESQGIKGVQEWRHNDFLQTYRIDLMRLVPFVSIILILEEVLPLIILYAPFLLPSTCKLPSQAKRIDELADRKRWDALVSLGNLIKTRDGVSGARSSAATPLGQERTATETQLEGLPEGSLPLLCRLLGLAPYGPSLYIRSRLRSTLATLSEEDSYFRSTSSPATSGSSADPVSHLSLSELRLILRRRGFPTSPLSLPQLRDNLTWWLSHPEDQTEKRLAALVALARSSTRVPGGPPPSSRTL